VVKMESKNKYRNFKQIVNSFYNAEIEALEEKDEKNIINIKEKINIEPKIVYDKMTEEIKLEVYLGNKNLYKIKDLSTFYERMKNGVKYKYGEKLELIHIRESFSDKCLDFLDYVLKYSEIIKYANMQINSNYKLGTKILNENFIVLTGKAFDELFDILRNQRVKFKKENQEQVIDFISDNPKIEFTLEKISENEYKFYPNIDVLKVNVIKGEKFNYVLTKNKLNRCSKDYENTVMRLLKIFRDNFSQEVLLGKEQLPELFSIIVPKMKNNIVVNGIERSEIEKYLPRQLKGKIYLDYDKNNYIIADLRFVYDNNEINPLSEKEMKNQKYRNVIEENKLLNLLRHTGFMVDLKNSRFILPNEEKIYEFVTDGINEYIEKFEVLTTDNFKNRQIKQPKIGNIGVKVENDLLQIDISNLNINPEEIEKIMEKYRLKKKFYRLKDGNFLNLKDNTSIEFLDKLISGTDLNYKELEAGIIKLPTNRALYLNQLLDKLEDEKVNKNTEFSNLIKKINKKPEEKITTPRGINAELREYQQEGYKWLKILDKYKFGGILADDMGLGKTLQVLLIIMSYIEQTSESDRKASLVISPSSLALNWKSEVNKFAKDIKVLVVQGTARERRKQIEQISDYDLVITSYDLLKRDIESYIKQNYKFRYVIADEAQYLKNSNTQNAVSIKQIQADTRFALTGTPMENSLAELWSIFDFIMPGYLFTYRKFRNEFEVPIVKEHDDLATKKLKMLIEPFVLRRTKAEVLTELPEKSVTVLKSNMQQEQEELYLSYLAEAKEEVRNAIDLNGYEKSQMKILAVLTRLRQICCHPSLFIDNYEAGSSKLEQCMEILKEGVSSGHKILLFSGYTSMFEIIEKELKKSGIKYFKLTGETKTNKRVQLVEEFNENNDIKVFLISLKAGGTGLNLTGADMVIHYDPWWNASAENQATDRAYRIGQKNNVHVYKLITKDSIEEKIYQLQQNKSALIDNMLDINTSFVNKLSREEIMSLFEK